MDIIKLIKMVCKELNSINIFKLASKIRDKKFLSSLYAIRKKNHNIHYDYSYNMWFKANAVTKDELDRQKKHQFIYNPIISIVVPVYNTPEEFMVDMLESVVNQSYASWELCIADASSSNECGIIVSRYKNKYNNIKYKFLNENKGISENSNEAIKMSNGEYMALLDHDDILTPNALFEVVKSINENNKPDILYTDEDKIDTNGNELFSPHFKPVFSPELLKSCNYISHLTVFRSELLKKVGLMRKEYDGSQDHDLILRLTEISKNIVHIPKVLYHWRTHNNSVALNPKSKIYAYESGKKAIESHLERNKIKAKVEYGENLGTYRVTYEFKDTPLVSILINNAEGKYQIEKCIKSIENKSTYKRYEILIQPTDISRIKGEYIIIMNSSLEVATPNWIEEMLGYSQVDDTGAVIGKIYSKYGNVIYDAGLFIDCNMEIGYCYQGLNKYDSGYFGREKVSQNVDAITTNCVMIRKSVFMKENLSYNHKENELLNGIDISLKLKKSGYQLVYIPFINFYSDEKISKSNVSISKEITKNIRRQGSHYIYNLLLIDR